MNEPDPRLKTLGARLDALLKAADVSGKELSDRTGWATSKVSRIRNGTQRPSAEDITRWAQETDSADQTDDLLAALAEVPVRRTQFQTGQAEDVQRDHDKLTAESSHIRYFDPAFITGLLQTREYALEVFREIWRANHRTDDVHAAVAGRMRRQVHLHEPSKTFQCLVWEPALLLGSIPTDVMVPQLHVLLTWLKATNVQFGVLPLRSDSGRTPLIGFQMYDDLAIGEDWYDQYEQPGDHAAETFDAMWSAAAIGEDARPFIENAIKEWRS